MRRAGGRMEGQWIGLDCGRGGDWGGRTPDLARDFASCTVLQPRLLSAVHGDAVCDGVVVVRDLISRLGVCDREANVRLDWRVAHCLQTFVSARRRLLAKDAAIVLM
jgi:hypothetical protein